jgi:hypothetical protein
MGWRFRRSVRLLQGVRLNLSKTGASFSVGPRGLTTNIGRRGVRTTVGLPGSAISYTTPTVAPGRRQGRGGPGGALAIVIAGAVLGLIYLLGR